VLAPTPNLPMTFEELEQLPESRGFRQELHHGELFEMPPPKRGHQRIQRRLLILLTHDAGNAGWAESEFGFRPLPQYEYWIADVAFYTWEREAAIADNGYFDGVPELVIEVLSPSNSMREMRERKKICLENGGKEFWIVDPDDREVEVSTPDGRSITYKSGQQVPLFFALDGRLQVDAIFD
jgi:Uma2 family endonuclease